MSDRGTGRDGPSIDELLEELAELRELDRRRHAHAPGSPAHATATRELEQRTRRLMDRFRDLHAVTRDVVTHTSGTVPATFLHLAQESRPHTMA